MGQTLAERFSPPTGRPTPHACLQALDLYRALRSARAPVEIATLQAKLGSDAGGQPFNMLAPVAARNLRDATGVAIQQSPMNPFERCLSHPWVEHDTAIS